MMNWNDPTLFPVNQLPARERRAYAALGEAQRTAYRVARLEGRAHGEAMRAARGVA